MTDVPGSLTWAELVVDEPSSVADFYHNLLHLNARTIALEDRRYRVLCVDDVPVSGVVRSAVKAHWRIYFSVSDLSATLSRAESIGGKVLSPPSATIPGTTALIRDPHGAIVGLMEADHGRGANSRHAVSEVDDNAGYPTSLRL
nr:VOC family protein [Gordonia sp. SID5947]